MVVFMKGFGCISEYSDKRSKDLMRAYREYISSCKHISMSDVLVHIVNMPSRRFWVSVERACVVIASISRGDKLNYMRRNKREMFLEIYRRYVLLKKDHPDDSMYKLVSIVVSQPAPKFYMAPNSAKVIIIKEKKQCLKERQKKLRR